MPTVRCLKWREPLVWTGLRNVKFSNHLAEVSFSEAKKLASNSKDYAIEDWSPAKFVPGSWSREKKVTFYCNVDGSSGYGGAAVELMKALKRMGVDVAFAGDVHGKLDDREFSKVKKGEHVGAVAVSFCQPHSYVYATDGANVAYTPWETTKVPKSWLAPMQKMDLVMTTCERNAADYASNGVNSKIEVVPHGIDPSFWKPKKDKSQLFGDYYTFLTVGHLSTRKGTDLLVKAFIEEFRPDEKAILVLKSTNPNLSFLGGVKDKRIHVICEASSREELRDMMEEADCFVFPTRGEGFGLPPLEAMAMGLPTIVTGWSGPADYCFEGDTFELMWSYSPAKTFTEIVYKEECGDWAEPDLGDLKSKMRRCFKDREEAKAMGLHASDRVREDWTWDKAAQVFIDKLDKHFN